jgi:ACS family hexuronate transporter-like MFS transporter
MARKQPMGYWKLLSVGPRRASASGVTMNDQARRPSKTLSGFTLGICALLFVGTVLNYLDRQVMALTADKIIADFHLSAEGLGKILASYRYAYGIGQVAGGFLVDAYGPLFVYPAAGALWSLGGLLMGFASSVGLMCGFNATLGAGEALHFPCALKATARLVPPKERALANGIFNSGAPVGAVLAPIIITALTVYYSWRAAFVVTGVLGFFWVATWLLYTRGSGEKLTGSGLVLSGALSTAGHILSLREFWVLAVPAIIINGVNYYLADWVPLYLKTTRGFNFGRGNMLSIAVYAGMWLGYLLIGILIRKLMEWGLAISAAKNWSLCISCLFLSSSIVAGLTPYRYVAVGCLGMTGMGMAGFMVIYLTLLQDLDPSHVGVTSGLLGGLGNLVYGYLNPYIGRLADMKESFIIFILIGCLPWLAFLAVYWGGWGVKEKKSLTPR